MPVAQNFVADFLKVVTVEIIIAVVLYVRCADSRISHDGTSASWFSSRSSHTVAVVVLVDVCRVSPARDKSRVGSAVASEWEKRQL